MTNRRIEIAGNTIQRGVRSEDHAVDAVCRSGGNDAVLAYSLSLSLSISSPQIGPLSSGDRSCRIPLVFLQWGTILRNQALFSPSKWMLMIKNLILPKLLLRLCLRPSHRRRCALPASDGPPMDCLWATGAW